MKKRLISLITSAAMLVMLLAGLKLEAYAKTYTITYDPNGGTPGQGFVETEQVTLSDTTQESWFTPYYHEEDVAPPAGAVFDGYDVNGQRVAAVTAVQSLLTENTLIKYLWKIEKYYTINYDVNGGTEGPDWVDSVKVKLNESGSVDPWFTPNYSAQVAAPPEGMEFDGFDVNGTKVAAVTAVQSLLTENTTIKYLWKESGVKNYLPEAETDTIFKKRSLRPIIFRFHRKTDDDKTIDLFRNLIVDRAILDRSNYRISRGSLVVELNPDYLESLPEGEHTLQPVFEDEIGPVVSFRIEKEGSSAPVSAPASAVQHEHSFDWEVVREATPVSDGEMACVCSECGAVSQRLPLSGYVAFNWDLAEKIRNAQPGAAVSVQTSMWVSLYAISLDELAKRPDVSVVIDFRYQGVNYQVTIPAGADIAALKDENGYAGFLFIGTKYGLTVPEER